MDLTEMETEAAEDRGQKRMDSPSPNGVLVAATHRHQSVFHSATHRFRPNVTDGTPWDGLKGRRSPAQDEANSSAGRLSVILGLH